jgi:hypothetical protein
VWGLHELGLPMPAAVSARWSAAGRDLRLRRLRVARLPRGATAQVRCTGRRCPFGRRSVAKRGGGDLDLLGVLGRAERTFRPGQALEVLVTAHAHDGKLVRWRLRAGRAPKRATLCVPLGNTKPRPRC